jgi:protein arginine kinase
MNNYNGTAVSCRVRLARNLSGYNFASTLTDRRLAKEIVNRTYKIVSSFGNFKLYEMSKLTAEEAEQLKERYVISEALKKNVFSGAVAVDSAERISVMINEEDHIREQCILNGEDLMTAYSKLYPLDGWLNNNLKFCKNQSYGYITACPTNLGTGLRASVMMFLPTLSGTDLINDLCKKAKANGLTVRGVFGEGSNGESCLYQVSNEVTLGKTELSIIKEVQAYVKELAGIEQVNALSYYNRNKYKVEDACFRAKAIMESCRILTYQEFTFLLADLKLGAMLKIINAKAINALDDLLVKCRPATLRAMMLNGETADNRAIGEFIDENQRLDVFRAQYVKNSLKKVLV